MNAPPSERRGRQIAPPAERLDGRVLAGKYAVLDLIGFGAMGAVYRARQLSLEKIVAVKVLHGSLANDDAVVHRFHREALAASRLDHVNSIRVLDYGEEPDGLLFIAMDYLDGRDLLAVINEEWPFPANRIVGILSQVLSALAVAHDQGVLHRDLKPENIMILRDSSEDGSPTELVKVCDFGIAKIIEPGADEHPAPAGARHSTGAVVVGTPAYMSPEQATCSPLDARTDLYSVGVILYQLLTAQLPFDATAPLGILIKHLNETPVPPSELNPGVDRQLEAVCLRALRKNPGERYQSAREMRAALRAVLGDASVPSFPVNPQLNALAEFDKRARSVQPVSRRLDHLPTQLAPRAPMSSKTKAGLVTAGAVAMFLIVFMSAIGRRSATVPSATAAAPAEGLATGPGPREERAAGAKPRETPPASPATAVTGEAPERVLRVEAHAAKRAASPARRPPLLSADLVAEPASPAAPESPGAGAAPPGGETPVALLVATPGRTGAAPPAPPPVEAPTTLDPRTARVELGAARDIVGTTPASVGRGIAPSAGSITACYRTALSSGAVRSAGAGVLHVETNEEGLVVQARLDGPLSAALGRCIAGSVRGRSIPNVDTGVASASIPLTFKASR